MLSAFPLAPILLPIPLFSTPGFGVDSKYTPVSSSSTKQKEIRG